MRLWSKQIYLLSLMEACYYEAPIEIDRKAFYNVLHNPLRKPVFAKHTICQKIHKFPIKIAKNGFQPDFFKMMIYGLFIPWKHGTIIKDISPVKETKKFGNLRLFSFQSHLKYILQFKRKSCGLWSFPICSSCLCFSRSTCCVIPWQRRFEQEISLC